MQINYFDFGVHKGDEIQMFLESLKHIHGLYVNVYGFEAHPDLASQASSRYSECDNIRIINKAIAYENSKVNLYIAEGNKMEGNSIFPTKNNVDPHNYVEVDGILFSDWLAENVPDYKNSINVIRFNIEGAEIHLFDDIINNGINEYIDLFLGSSGGEDILKCSEISHLHSKHEEKLAENGITVHQFCAASVNNISSQRIRDILIISKTYNEDKF